MNLFDLQFFASTSVSDLVIPEVYTAYMQENITEKSNLIAMGIAVTDETMAGLASGAGATVNVPFIQALTGDDEVLDEDNPSVPKAMGSDKQVAIRLLRISSWSFNDLATILSGADPIGKFYAQVAQYWKNKEQASMISIVKGLFASGGALATTHLNDISADAGAEKITAEAILDTKQLLGDSADQLEYVAMHSATKTELQKQNLIETIVDSEGKVMFQRYLDYTVIVDDGMPVDTDVYTTVFFKRGAFSYDSGNPNGMIPIEPDRDTLGSKDIIVTRRSTVIHPQGCAWTGSSMALTTPTNVELATAANWTKVMSDKNIGMVALKHKLANSVA